MAQVWRLITAVALTLVVVAMESDAAPLTAPDNRPWNVVFVLADDLGWAELGCYGNTFNETPHLDRLAAAGVRFTNAYAAAPVCSPYRAALMSGQWPARLGITDYLRPDSEKHLPREVVTVAELFKQAGYATGISGKWHLSGYTAHGAEYVGPRDQGFDEHLLPPTRGIGGGSYFHPYHWNPDLPARLTNTKHPQTGEPTEYFVDRHNLEAVEFIERHRDEPFFLFKSHMAVHTRLDGRADLVERFAKKPGAGVRPNAPRNNVHLAAQLYSIDEGVGMIVAKLRELGIADRTVIIFTSDNGGEDRVTSNAPLRAGKSTLHEGGIREPLIVYWPGVTPSNKSCDTPTVNCDFYPAFAEMLGVKPPADQPVDGVSILPLLRDPSAELERDTLYWHYPLDRPHFLGGRSSSAVRESDFKLIEFFDSGALELYDLANDTGETTNLAESQPDRAKRMQAKLKAWREQVGAVILRHDPPPPPLPEPTTLRLKLAGKTLAFNDHGTKADAGTSPTARRFDGKTYLDLPRPQSPAVAGQRIAVMATVVAESPNGVILAHGGNRHGYAIYLDDGRPTFSTTVDFKRTTIFATDRLPRGGATIAAVLEKSGRMSLHVNGKLAAEGRASGPLVANPGDSLQIGADTVQPVGEYETVNAFRGVIDEVALVIGEVE